LPQKAIYQLLEHHIGLILEASLIFIIKESNKVIYVVESVWLPFWVQNDKYLMKFWISGTCTGKKIFGHKCTKWLPAATLGEIGEL
jgi:hypothetical protein